MSDKWSGLRCHLGMGLTIHWKTCAPAAATLAEVTQQLHAWREACLDLPFVAVTEMQHFTGVELARRLQDHEDPERWFLLQGCRYMRSDPDDEDSRYVSIDPVELVGFTAFPGESCEPMTCLLARYPATVTAGGRQLQSAIEGWQGQGFAKTQYASVQGSEYFLQCHLTIIAALDVSGRVKPASLGRVKTSHFERGFALRATRGCTERDEPSRSDPTAIHQSLGRARLVAASHCPRTGRRSLDGAALCAAKTSHQPDRRVAGGKTSHRGQPDHRVHARPSGRRDAR